MFSFVNGASSTKQANTPRPSRRLSRADPEQGRQSRRIRRGAAGNGVIIDTPAIVYLAPAAPVPKEADNNSELACGSLEAMSGALMWGHA